MNQVLCQLKCQLQHFILLGILLIPFKWNLFEFHNTMINVLFFPLIRLSAKAMGIELILEDLSSDSKGLYIHVILLLAIAFLLTVMMRSKICDRSYIRIEKLIRTIASYYLAFLLFKYGLDKFMKTQFYLPEPNILFTPLGKLDKDILFWSTMGSSYTYNIFMGFAEVIPAILLMIPKTRQAGAVIAIGVLMNVLAINMAFDISVKLFSAFLLLTSFYIAIPTFERLINRGNSSPSDTVIKPPTGNPLYRKIVLSIILLIMLCESLYPLAATQTWNDDQADRPYLHGAYENLDKNSEIRRLFVHRDGYLILQDRKDNFTDLKLHIDKNSKTFLLKDYDLRQTPVLYHFNERTGILRLDSDGKKSSFKTINLKEVPVLKDHFHWTVD